MAVALPTPLAAANLLLRSVRLIKQSIVSLALRLPCCIPDFIDNEKQPLQLKSQLTRDTMASIQQVSSSGVEITPDLSPLERRNSLEKHLQQRPDEKDLKVSRRS